MMNTKTIHTQPLLATSNILPYDVKLTQQKAKATSTMRNLMSCATLQPKNVSKSNKWQKESAFLATEKKGQQRQLTSNRAQTHTHKHTHKVAYEK